MALFAVIVELRRRLEEELADKTRDAFYRLDALRLAAAQIQVAHLFLPVVAEVEPAVEQAPQEKAPATFPGVGPSTIQ